MRTGIDIADTTIMIVDVAEKNYNGVITYKVKYKRDNDTTIRRTFVKGIDKEELAIDAMIWYLKDEPLKPWLKLYEEKEKIKAYEERLSKIMKECDWIESETHIAFLDNLLAHLRSAPGSDAYEECKTEFEKLGEN